MDAQAVVEGAMRALVAQDARAHLAWFHDDVSFEAPPNPPVKGKFAYFQLMAPALTPGSGARVSQFKIMHVGSAGDGVQWIRATLELQVTRDGRLFPSEPAEYATQEAEMWYAVEGDRIVQIKGFHRARMWHWSDSTAAVAEV